MKSFTNLLAYIAVIMVSISLLVQALLGGNVEPPVTNAATAFKLTADIIAYSLLAISSFAYVRSRRNIIFLIVWIIAIVLIAVSYII